MLWLDFEPYVMPYVIGCPQPLMEHHVRQAAIEFFRDTKAWRLRLEPELTDGLTPAVDLWTPRESLVLDVEDVAVNGERWPLVTPDVGDQMALHDDDTWFCFTRDGRELEVYPLQAQGLEVVATVNLLPTEDSTGMPDPFKPYARHIALGAVGSIKALPAQVFSAADAPAFEERFRQRIKAESARLARGTVAAGGGRIPPSFL